MESIYYCDKFNFAVIQLSAQSIRLEGTCVQCHLNQLRRTMIWMMKKIREEFSSFVKLIVKWGKQEERYYSWLSVMELGVHLFNYFSQEINESRDYILLEMPWSWKRWMNMQLIKYMRRANDGPFLMKAWETKISMHRTKLRNKYNHYIMEERFIAIIKQRNKYVNLLQKAKFDYYKNIKLGKLTDNHKIWKTVKPLFSDKV